MEFLKALFGGKALTYDELVTAINAHNGNEANKESQIKIGNLGGGEYVGKGKYDSLNDLLTGKQTELDTANKLIADLQKKTKDNEELQSQFTAYQSEIATLQAKLTESQIDGALKVALLSAKANDIDYVTYKIKEKLRGEGKSLELDENGNIKNWDTLLSNIKTQIPKQFDSAAGKTEVDAIDLPEHNNTTEGMTRSEFMKKPYAERAAFAQNNPEAYASMMKK